MTFVLCHNIIYIYSIVAIRSKHRPEDQQEKNKYKENSSV